VKVVDLIDFLLLSSLSLYKQAKPSSKSEPKPKPKTKLE